MRFPMYDSRFEVSPNRAQRGSNQFMEEYDFYHWSKGQWQDIVNTMNKRSRRWWDDYREFYEKRRGLAEALGEMKIRTLKEYINKYKPNVFIETGTYHGETSWMLKDSFTIVHTIEIEPELYEKAVSKFANTNVVCHLGNSADIIPMIIKGLDEPALFWIDAHWCGEGDAPMDRQSPVVGELDAILSHPIRHIVLIDDARYFGGIAERDTEKEGYPDQDWIQAKANQYGYVYSLERDIFRLTPA